MTAAFPLNGRGQINLPPLMSANGTGPLLPPPPASCRSESKPRFKYLRMHVMQVASLRKITLLLEVCNPGSRQQTTKKPDTFLSLEV